MLLKAAQNWGAKWCLCFDADERLTGTLPLLKGSGFRFRLFDGYLTEERQMLYQMGYGRLSDLPRMWGPEYRNILMLFRVDNARYYGLDKREPAVSGGVLQADTFVKHYGKCLSVEHWEETCEYYTTYFAKYREKWEARKGKAIHTTSDFGRGLYVWEDLMLSPNVWVKI